jgi:hypothetical protein
VGINPHIAAGATLKDRSWLAASSRFGARGHPILAGVLMRAKKRRVNELAPIKDGRVPKIVLAVKIAQ